MMRDNLFDLLVDVTSCRLLLKKKSILIFIIDSTKLLIQDCWNGRQYYFNRGK